MAKVRLTERELTNIIKRVINEQSTSKNTDAKIPPVVKEKGIELAGMAQNIITKHMEYCKLIKQMVNENIDCEFVTKRFKEQPLWVIADLNKSLDKSIMGAAPSFKSPSLNNIFNK
jgi:rhamnogalacturonyl hydrolase YesR